MYRGYQITEKTEEDSEETIKEIEMSSRAIGVWKN